MREALRALPGAPRPVQGGGGPDGPAGVHQLRQGPQDPRGARVRRRAVRPVRGTVEGGLGKDQLLFSMFISQQNLHHRRKERVLSWWWCAGATWRARITSSSGSRWSKVERNKRDTERGMKKGPPTASPPRSHFNCNRVFGHSIQFRSDPSFLGTAAATAD